MNDPKYLEKIQEYLKNNNIQNDSENFSLNKNQLLECFQMILKDQQKNDNTNNTNNNIQSNSNMGINNINNNDNNFINNNRNDNIPINNNSNKMKFEEPISKANMNKMKFEEPNPKLHKNQPKGFQNKKINKITPKPNVTNFDDMPLPSSKNKMGTNLDPFTSKNNNIDDMPIKGSNFNEILERELAKEKQSNNNTEDIPLKGGSNFNEICSFYKITH